MRQASVLGKLCSNGSQSDTEITLKLATSLTIRHCKVISTHMMIRQPVQDALTAL